MKNRRTIREQDLLEFRRDYFPGVVLPDFLPSRRPGYFLVPEGLGEDVVAFLNWRRRQRFGNEKVDRDEARYASLKKRRAQHEGQRSPTAIRREKALRRGWLP